MNPINRLTIPLLMVLLMIFAAAPAGAQVLVQCPGDVDGDAAWTSPVCSETPEIACQNNGDCLGGNNKCTAMEVQPANVKCIHLSGGDGFARMADGRPQYIFSFADLTGTPEADAMENGILAAAWPSPAIVLDEGQEFYLTLTNVGMLIRPDLFDPHTIHFHGFPQSSSVFDGLPESGLSINMGASLTYYYNIVEPGTFMYHCHVEATEHMQMGMLGNLYVRAGQNKLPAGTDLNGFIHQDGYTYAYNDGDGSTFYDVEFPLQLGSFDPDFHDASWFVQPLPFAMMWDRYPMINGRGYPDTVNTGAIGQPLDPDTLEDLNGPVDSQVEHSLVTATAGQKVLLRLSNLNITDVHTLSSPSIPMQVVGIDAKQLVAEDGSHLYYKTNSVTMGGGMSADVILDTAGVPAGEYYLYAANLQYLANNDAPGLGGMMTKIVVNP